MNSLSLRWIAGEFAVARLGPADPIPPWAWSGPFASVTRTPDEMSIICESTCVPPEVHSQAGLIAFRVEGPLAFDVVGVLRSLCVPLAEAGIAIVAVGTFDTDYVLVPASARARVVEELTRAGHRFIG